jgi:RimJ/RimL family protein N-acetyltransferase
MDTQPITLTGRFVRLEPLSEAHVPDLTIAGQDERIWRWMLYGKVVGEQAMRAWVQEMLTRRARGADLPFAVIHQASGRAIGATRYINMEPKNRGLEIGGTWYAIEHQRTAVNTESKYLLLEHAFEAWKCIRVQFKTDLRNEHSQRALERLGAVREGVFRNHMILGDGTIRHSVFYSIVDREWPAVKAQLGEKLSANYPK